MCSVCVCGGVFVAWCPLALFSPPSQVRVRWPLAVNTTYTRPSLALSRPLVPLVVASIELGLLRLWIVVRVVMSEVLSHGPWNVRAPSRLLSTVWLGACSVVFREIEKLVLGTIYKFLFHFADKNSGWGSFTNYV